MSHRGEVFHIVVLGGALHHWGEFAFRGRGGWQLLSVVQRASRRGLGTRTRTRRAQPEAPRTASSAITNNLEDVLLLGRGGERVFDRIERGQIVSRSASKAVGQVSRVSVDFGARGVNIRQRHGRRGHTRDEGLMGVLSGENVCWVQKAIMSGVFRVSNCNDNDGKES